MRIGKQGLRRIPPIVLTIETMKFCVKYRGITYTYLVRTHVKFLPTKGASTKLKRSVILLTLQRKDGFPLHRKGVRFGSLIGDRVFFLPLLPKAGYRWRSWWPITKWDPRAYSVALISQGSALGSGPARPSDSTKCLPPHQMDDIWKKWALMQ